MSACATVIHDLKVSSVVRSRGVGKDLLQVDISTHTDLEALHRRWNAIPRVRAYFCDRPQDFALLGGSLAPILGGQRWSSSARLKDARFEYTTHLNVEGSASPSSVPPSVAFNLRTMPEDVCIELQGGYMWYTIRSNKIQVSAKDIGNVLAQ